MALSPLASHACTHELGVSIEIPQIHTVFIRVSSVVYYVEQAWLWNNITRLLNADGSQNGSSYITSSWSTPFTCHHPCQRSGGVVERLYSAKQRNTFVCPIIRWLVVLDSGEAGLMLTFGGFSSMFRTELDYVYVKSKIILSHWNHIYSIWVIKLVSKVPQLTVISRMWPRRKCCPQRMDQQLVSDQEIPRNATTWSLNTSWMAIHCHNRL